MTIRGILTEKELVEYLKKKQSITTTIEEYKQVIETDKKIIRYLESEINKKVDVDGVGYTIDLTTVKIREDGIILNLKEIPRETIHIPYIVLIESTEELDSLEGYAREVVKTKQKIKNRDLVVRLSKKLR